jgi:Phytanoyl-CoA dioxygenase (PhyH)
MPDIPIFVSITTINSRMGTISQVLASLLEQTLAADRIILNISSEPYMLDHGVVFRDLPEAVRHWIENGRIEVYQVPNLGPYRKLLPTLRRFAGTEFLVATADDDVIYPPGWLNGLVAAYHVNHCVTAYRCRSMRFGQNGRLLPYHDWPFTQWSAGADPGQLRSLHIFPTGRGGILYHSTYFPDLDFLEELRLLAPGQDDLAFKIAMLIRGVPVALVSPEAAGGSSGEFAGFHNPENLYYLNREPIKGLSVNDAIWNRIIDHCGIKHIGAKALSNMAIRPSANPMGEKQMVDTPSGMIFDERNMVFDEDWYLGRYRDIADAVAHGSLLSARAHFLANGRQEGRSGYRFEPDWYMQAYPMAKRDLTLGQASSPRDHYERFGRFRGYLPYADAIRPESLTKQHPRFGGLWVDLPNAHDIVAGRHDAGLITETQAALLSEFIEKGFVVLRAAVPSDVIDKARYDLAKAYLGSYETLLFDSPAGTSAPAPWRPATNDHAAAALDIHQLSPAIRALIFSDPVVSLLQLLFDSRPIAYKSEGCLRGSAKPYGQDGVRAPTTRPRHSAGVWFALERGEPGANKLGCWPGSHRLDDLPAEDGHRRAVGLPHGDAAAGANISRSGLGAAEQLAGSDHSEQILSLDCGDAVIWHPGLWHGEQPVALSRITRRSIEAHYCPSYVAPLSWESTPPRLVEYHNLGYYTTPLS